MRVIGVFRSCDIAVSMRVRSSMKRDSRCCMVLNARAACCTSSGPSSGSGGRLMSSPSSSAASASTYSGRVTQRTATNDSTSTATSRTTSVSSQPPAAGRRALRQRRNRSVAQLPSRSCTCGAQHGMPPGARPRSAAPIMPRPIIVAWRPAGGRAARIRGRQPAGAPLDPHSASLVAERAAQHRRDSDAERRAPGRFGGRRSAAGASCSDTTSGGTLNTATMRSRSAGAQRVEQLDDVGDPLRRLHAARR